MFFQLNCSCFFVLSISLPPSIAGIVLCFSSNSATWRPTAHKSHQYCLFATVAALVSPTLPVSLWLLLFGSYCCCFPSALSGTENSLPLSHLLTAQIAFCSTAAAASASVSAAASACAVFIVALCVDLCALHVCVGVCGLQGVQATQVVLSPPTHPLSCWRRVVDFPGEGTECTALPTAMATAAATASCCAYKLVLVINGVYN